jgi:hypothetical protein
MPSLCSIETHFTSLRAPGVPSAFGHELRHHEERDALHALGRAVDAREHQVDDVLGVVVLAVGDEDLLALEAVAAVGLRGRLGAHQRQVAARLRLGEVHGAGPLARDHLRQVRPCEANRAHVVDRLDRALGEHRAELEGEVGRAPHLFHRGRDEVRQALAAEIRRPMMLFQPAWMNWR